jgi:hypothetical protein
MLARRLAYSGLILVLGTAIIYGTTYFLGPALFLGSTLAGLAWPFALSPGAFLALTTAPGAIVIVVGLTMVWRARSPAALSTLAAFLVLTAAAIFLAAMI